ncbi:MAG TPA: hypothetical protein VM600_00475, partial [Actinomycetota bacterium]|nr:hypothetical protein [Actinomycetota bacterium]
GCVERRWTGPGITTSSITLHDEPVAEPNADFTIRLGGVHLASEALPIVAVSARGDRTAHGTIQWKAELPGVMRVTRTVEIFAGIAGFRSQTSLEAIAPLALGGYTLDEINVGPARTSVHAFRAGADWRDPTWSPRSIGDAHTGDWRETKTAPRNAAITANGQWTSVARDDGTTIGVISERRNYASSVGGYDGAIASVGVDFSRDVVYLGPFEEAAHVENPGPGPARHRVLPAATSLALEPAFAAFGRDADDEAWQFAKYMQNHRTPPYRKAVVFNSDKVDKNEISTGAKDDMNYERFLRILPAVREIGADTFVFDDGWMARAGDWCPDSGGTPECSEPRWNGRPDHKFRPRFEDAYFDKVRRALKGDPNTDADDITLGLWMNPMSFHPSSQAFLKNPQWSCMPVGTATGGASIVDPNGSSNEAGIGLWNPRALGLHPDTNRPVRMIEYLKDRIVRAIEQYGARYFKFDFLVWVDCAGADPVTMYEYHDDFVQMLDEVIAAYPDVTYQVDDTNDHRMFPFETIARGPSWFLNGGPTQQHALYTAWNVAPYVPGSALGMRSLSSSDRRALGIDACMAAAITSHLTFSFPIDDELTSAERSQVKRWTDFYRANRDTLTGFTYPLADDPRENGWTALQPWNGDSQSGWLLAYRQQAENGSTSIRLRGLWTVPDDTMFRMTLIDPATGSHVALPDASADQLRSSGVDVSAATRGGYAIVRIERA